MEWAWIPITIWAAFCQTIRTGLQKQLKGRLSTNGASFVRFAYGLPVALLYLAAVSWGSGRAMPEPHSDFYAWTAFGAIAQILATNLLILALSMRNFVVATAYSKTEALQAAAFGMLILAEPVSLGGVAAIVIGTLGVLLISLKGSGEPMRAFLLGWTERSALIGIGSGALFAVSAIGFRAASLSLDEEFLPLAAATTLVHAIVLQITVMVIYLVWREPGELHRVIAAWKPGLVVGIASAAGSAGWFTAMALQVAAYVRMLGMTEMVFTFLMSYLVFRERPARSEIIGVIVLIAGILLALAAR
ncbi:DMT family transporter [uncultured Ferrovibrio sp.]|jgi:drug/metabolite transporter (DMT)-like permease|uniref:DMT family transporter n=1 Tax=uncultured Ferrovibrio sp. TaxID=1576913 RepID=UPI002612D2AD|nr:DMT family transporter [uncultured Ferrovibrio sp.]